MIKRASDAVAMGRHLIQHFKAGDIEACAITAAVKANGIWHNADQAYTDIHILYPWIMFARIDCPRCLMPMAGAQIIWHVFDYHVMANEITYEWLVDWIRSVEPVPFEELVDKPVFSIQGCETGRITSKTPNFTEVDRVVKESK